MRLRLLIPLLLPVAAAAADHLPDMRWIFERALRLDARGDVHRFDRVRAWALVPLLYPDDEPGTENDQVWRLVARDALSRLDASAAGYPPPREALPSAPPPSDPVADLLGAAVADEPLGGVRVRSATAGTGLEAGDRIVAADGAVVHDPTGFADAVAAAGRNGWLRLGLDGGREVDLRIAAERAAPELAALRLHGEQQPWEPPRRCRLPALDGLWLVSGVGEVAIDGRTPRTPPEARTWSALAAAGAVVVARGRHDLRAVPLTGAWRPASARLVLGVRAGQAVVIESDGPLHRISVFGPDGSSWSDNDLATRHRLARHGPPGTLAEAAIERNGMLVIGVRPVDGVRLRILTDTDAGDPRP